jgi:superoxide dismutase, Fe-Mn family
MFELPKLPYTNDELEPNIDAKTMEIHHDKHHGGYVDKLNAALEGSELLNKNIAEILMTIDKVPEDKKQAVIKFGGGHANHSLFWEILSKDGGNISGDIAEAINSKFGSFEEFKKQFTETAVGLFGSGWCWLVVDEGELEIVTTPNQDSPLMDLMKPILGLDVWEHAYYLKYQNKRPDYIGAFWNIVNWDKVNEFYQKAK